METLIKQGAFLVRIHKMKSYKSNVYRYWHKSGKKKHFKRKKMKVLRMIKISVLLSTTGVYIEDI